MKTFSCLSLSGFAHASTVWLIALVLTGAARADTVQDFVVRGTATNVSGGVLGSCAAGAICSFSGTMTVDVTIGTVTAYDIIFPGLAPFNCCASQGPFASGWLADSDDNINGVVLRFDFTTTTPGSLVDFEGGSITGLDVVAPTLYSNLGGNITPVPEPSSLALLGTGIFGIASTIRRRFPQAPARAVFSGFFQRARGEARIVVKNRLT